MKPQDIRLAFLEEINRIAPDIDPETVSDADHLRDDLELDSMDILNLVAAIDARLGISIPEQDYAEIATPGLAMRYLSGRFAGS